MQSIMVYDFAPGSGELLGSRQVQRHTGVNLPAGATDIAPPAESTGFARCFNGQVWEYISDHRGEEYYSTETGQKVTISDLGDLPEDITGTPKGAYEKWDSESGAWVLDEELAAQSIRTERNSRLSACDYVIMLDYPLTDKSEWEAYRQALRDITSDPAFPWKGNGDTAVPWPALPESNNVTAE